MWKRGSGRRQGEIDEGHFEKLSERTGFSSLPQKGVRFFARLSKALRLEKNEDASSTCFQQGPTQKDQQYHTQENSTSTGERSNSVAITSFRSRCASFPRTPSTPPSNSPCRRCSGGWTTSERARILRTSIWRVRSDNAEESRSTELITRLIRTSWRCSCGSTP